MKRLRRVLAVVLTIALVLSLFGDSLLATDFEFGATEVAPFSLDGGIPEPKITVTVQCSDNGKHGGFHVIAEGGDNTDGNFAVNHCDTIVGIRLDWEPDEGAKSHIGDSNNIPDSFTVPVSGNLLRDLNFNEYEIKDSNNNVLAKVTYLNGVLTFNLTDTFKNMIGRYLYLNLEVTNPGDGDSWHNGDREVVEIGKARYDFVYSDERSEVRGDKTISSATYDETSGKVIFKNTLRFNVIGETDYLQVTDTLLGENNKLKYGSTATIKRNGVNIGSFTIPSDAKSFTYNGEYSFYDGDEVVIEYETYLEGEDAKAFLKNGNVKSSDLTNEMSWKWNKPGTDKGELEGGLDQQPVQKNPEANPEINVKKYNPSEWNGSANVDSFDKVIDVDGKEHYRITWYVEVDLSGYYSLLSSEEQAQVQNMTSWDDILHFYQTKFGDALSGTLHDQLTSSGVTKDISNQLEYQSVDNGVYKFKYELITDTLDGHSNKAWFGNSEDGTGDPGATDGFGGTDNGTILKWSDGSVKETGELKWQVEVYLPLEYDKDVYIQDTPGDIISGGESGWIQKVDINSLKFEYGVPIDGNVYNISWTNIGDTAAFESMYGAKVVPDGNGFKITFTDSVKYVNVIKHLRISFSTYVYDGDDKVADGSFKVENHAATNKVSTKAEGSYDNNPGDNDNPSIEANVTKGQFHKNQFEPSIWWYVDFNFSAFKSETKWDASINNNVTTYYLTFDRNIDGYIKDVLPLGLRYVDGTAYIGLRNLHNVPSEYLDDTQPLNRYNMNAEVSEELFKALGEVNVEHNMDPSTKRETVEFRWTISPDNFDEALLKKMGEVWGGDLQNDGGIIRLYFKTEVAIPDADFAKELAKGNTHFYNNATGKFDGEEVASNTADGYLSSVESFLKKTYTTGQESARNFADFKGNLLDNQDLSGISFFNSDEIQNYIDKYYKTGAYVNDLFAVDINPQSLQLISLGNGRLKLVDKMGENLSIILDSVRLIDVDADKVYTVAWDDFSATYNDETNETTFVMPDGKHFILLYWASLHNVVAENGSYKFDDEYKDQSYNEIYISAYGEVDNNGKTTTDKIWAVSGGGGGTGNLVNVFKFFKTTNSHGEESLNPLEGASFTLYKATYDIGTGVFTKDSEVATRTSGSDGTFLFDNLELNQVYVIEETSVPSGYGKAKLIYFVIENDNPSADFNATYKALSELCGNGTKATLADGSVLRIVRSDGTISIENKPGEEKTKTGSTTLDVTKTLKNYNGSDEKTYDFSIAQVETDTVKANITKSTAQITVSKKNPTVKLEGAFAIEFEATGEYHFTVRETSKTAGGISVDTTVYEVTITVGEGEDKLTVSSTVIKKQNETDTVSEIKFINTYSTTNTPSVEPELTKDYSRTLVGNDFEFAVTITDENGNSVSGVKVDGAAYTDAYTVKNDIDGKIKLGKIEFSNVGTYVVKVHEVNKGDSHISYDSRDISITYVVSDNNDGTLIVSEPEYSKSCLADGENNTTFYNTYTSYTKASFTLKVDKNVENFEESIASYKYNFIVKELPNGTETPYESVKGTDLEFFTRDFTEADLNGNTSAVFQYEVWEVENSDNDGITIDQTHYIVTVTVTKNDATKELDTSVSITVKDGAKAEKVVFNNKYEKPTVTPDSLTFGVAKKLTDTSDATNTERTFKFKIESAADYTGKVTITNPEISVILRAGNKSADSEKSFGLEFKEKGEYKFTVSEVQDTGAGWTYDKTVYNVTVNVGLSDDGKSLVVTDKTVTKTVNGVVTPSDIDSVEFVNDYHKPIITPAKYKLTLKKNFTVAAGQTAPENLEFTVVIEEGENKEPVVKTVKAGDEITVLDLEFDSVTGVTDTYTYKIYERNTGVDHVTYDDTYYIVTIKVKKETADNGDVTYTETHTVVHYDAKGNKIEDVTGDVITVSNSYYVPKTTGTSYSLDLTKVLTGAGAPTDTDFTVIVEQGGTKTEKTVKAGKTVKVVDLAVNSGESTEYVYKIYEKNTGVDYITYDDTYYIVTVSITKTTADNGDIAYTETHTVVHYDANGNKIEDVAGDVITVSNSYYVPKTTGTSYSLDLTKLLTGAGAPTDTDFTVIVEQGSTKTEKTVKASETIKVIDLAVNSGESTEYVYKIYEKNTGVTGIIYDSTYYIVTVNVTKTTADNGDVTYTETHTVVHYDANGNKLEDVAGNVVTVTNTYKPLDTRANISVLKTLVGRAWTSTDVFTFVLTDANGAEVDRVSVNKESQTGTFKTILFSEPGVYKYTVTEVLGSIDGIVYDTAAHEVTVTVKDNGGELLATVDYSGSTVLEIKNTFVPKVGDLIVTKSVSGNAASTVRRFTFRVALSDSSINGVYGQMAFTNGVATFTLAHGESAVASGLPAGISYTVAELDASDYIAIANGASGTIQPNGSAVASFVNYKENRPEFGGLAVTKTVEGEGADLTQRFTFTVSLSDATINGTYGGMTFVNGVATFTLAHGETATASGLPAGIAYSVSEAETENFTFSATGTSGIISANTSAVAAFVNTYEAPATGGLSVTKTVAGEGAEVDRLFTFTVSLSDGDINGAYGDMYFTNGVATFQLRHGESAYASGLPAGTGYSVSESSADGYISTSTGASGTIVADESAVAAFTNTKEEEEEENPHDDDTNPGVEEEYNPHDDDANAGVGFDRFGNPIRMDDANPATGNYELEMFYNAMTAVTVVVIISLAALFVLIVIKKMRKIGE